MSIDAPVLECRPSTQTGARLLVPLLATSHRSAIEVAHHEQSPPRSRTLGAWMLDSVPGAPTTLAMGLCVGRPEN